MSMPLFVLLSLSSPAFAAEALSISSMQEHDGSVVIDSLQGEFAQLVRQVGVTVSAPATAGILGANQYEITATTTLALPPVNPNGAVPAPWSRATPDEDPSAIFALEQINFRKGLPIGLEIDGRFGFGPAHQGVIGGGVRASIFDSGKALPDVTGRMGYTGFVGNEELKVGVFELGVGLSTSLKSSSLSPPDRLVIPFFDMTYLRSYGAPVVSNEIAEQLDLHPATPNRASLDYSEDLTTTRFGAGLAIESDVLRWSSAMSWAIGGVFALNVSIGVGF